MGSFGTELIRLLSEFEEGISRPCKSQTVLDHHEDTSAFKQKPISDIRWIF